MAKLFSIFLVLLCFSKVYAVDYSLFDSIDEVIHFETTCVQSANSSEELSDAYASRGESLLLCGNFEAALDDFFHAYDYAKLISNKSISQSNN